MVLRSSGKKELELGRPRKVAPLSLEGLKRDLRAEEADLRAEEEEEAAVLADWSRTERRSQRQEGQKPENCSSGWRSQLMEFRWGCGGCGGGGKCSSVVGFMPNFSQPHQFPTALSVERIKQWLLIAMEEKDSVFEMRSSNGQ